jgi:hypothetical protein
VKKTQLAALLQRLLRSKNARLWIALGLMGAFIPLGLSVRTWAMKRAIAQGTSLLRNLHDWVPANDTREAEDEEFFPFLKLLDPKAPFGPPEAPTGTEVPSASQPAVKPARVAYRPPPISPPPTSVFAPAQRVLAWANHRLIPQGRSRGREYGFPPGIELSNVANLGIGLLDGDRLISVAGVPVGQRAEVVTQVLAARGRRESSIVARLARRTATGIQEFSVTVEQPYLADFAEETNPN